MITHEDINAKLAQLKTDHIYKPEQKLSIVEQWLIHRGLKTLMIEKILKELPKYKEF